MNVKGPFLGVIIDDEMSMSTGEGNSLDFRILIISKQSGTE